MSKLVEAKDPETKKRRSFIRTSDIVSVKKNGSNSGECTVTTKQGKTYVIGRSVEAMLSELAFQGEWIPAHPGYSVLYTQSDPTDISDFIKAPVVGWIKFRDEFEENRDCYVEYFFSMPIVAPVHAARFLRDAVLAEEAIVKPDGTVISTLDLREYESVEKFVKDYDSTRGSVYSKKMRS